MGAAGAGGGQVGARSGSAADGYAIRPATPADLPLLPAIERAAAARFRGTPLAAMADAPLAATAIDPARERVWVASAPDGAIAGFAIARPLDGGIHLHELDVHPAHDRRGLGARLIGAVAAWALETDARAITLLTFRDIPWNAPYYARLGFVPLVDEAVPPGLRALREAEGAAGLPLASRLALRLTVGGTQPG
jgi:GNAT superfamily N-acetyltransferase